MWKLLRSNRDVRFLFIAQVVSFAGDWFAYVAFVGVVQDIGDASILVTLIYVAQTLPAFLMTPVSGPVADRFNRRVVIATVSSAQAVAAVGLLFVDSDATLWIGYACLCAISALGSFVAPAAQAALPNLVRSPSELAKASVLFGSLWGAMLAIGAALGGVVAGTFGRDVAFIANAVSFVIAAVSVALIRRPMQAPRDERAARTRMRPLADMREALGYARRDSVLLAMLASKATFAMGAGIVGLLAVLVTEEFGGGDGEFGMVFDVATHLGTLVATVIYFRDDLLSMAVALPRLFTDAPEARLMRLVAIGTIPIVIVGLLFAKWIEAHLRVPIVTVVTLSVGAVGLLLVERLGPRTRGVDDLTPVDAAAFGVAQAAALIPGLSRSGSTITVGMLLGVRREAAARFTFLLGIPAVVAALGKESLELRHLALTPDLVTVLVVGVVTSGVVGYLSIRFLLRYLASHRLDVFAYYRLALAAVVWWFVH